MQVVEETKQKKKTTTASNNRGLYIDVNSFSN